MERKKDISELIKANQDRLNEAPSKRAWQKLENRLDARKNKHQSSLYRQLAMVAAVIALVAIVSLLSLMQHNETGLMAMNEEKTAMPYHLEVIEAPTDIDKTVYHIAAFQQKYKSKTATIINEGPKEKQLVPSPRFVSNEEQKYYAKHKNNKGTIQAGDIVNNTAPTKASAPDNISSSDYGYTTSPTTTMDIELVQKAEAKKQLAYNYDIVEEAESLSEPEPLAATTIEPPNANHEIKKDSYGNEIEFGRTADVIVSAKEKDRRLEAQIEAADLIKAKDDTYLLEEAQVADAADKLATASPMRSSKKHQFKELNAHANSIQIDAYPDQANLSLFKWMVGQWHGATNNNGLSIEQWELKDEFTIEGTGSIIINGDTTFTEAMRIQKIGPDLYYILTLDQSKKPVHFKLKSYTNQQAVFENTQLQFPNQVILQQNNQNNFSTILQNKAPLQVQTEQQKYIQNRNVIKNEQAVRNLSRVKQ